MNKLYIKCKSIWMKPSFLVFLWMMMFGSSLLFSSVLILINSIVMFATILFFIELNKRLKYINVTIKHITDKIDKISDKQKFSKLCDDLGFIIAKYLSTREERGEWTWLREFKNELESFEKKIEI